MGRVIVATSSYKWNDYIVEYIEHYLSLGFDAVYIFDDSPDDYLHLKDFEDIQNFVKLEKVFIFDKNTVSLTYSKISQMNFYNWVYNNVKFDWLACFDTDEFLELVDEDDIHKFLNKERFCDVDTILFSWMFYTDNNHFYKTPGKIQERFTEPWNNWNKPSTHTKFIIKSNIPDMKINSPHCPGIEMSKNLKIMTASGYILDKPMIRLSPKIRPTYDSAYIKHYWTLSMEEFFMKLSYGRNDIPKDNPEHYREISSYYMCNYPTPEREHMLREFMQKYKQLGYPLRYRKDEVE